MTTDADLRADAERVSRYLRWLVAVVSLGAAGIHFAVSGEHFAQAWTHGTFFVLVAWVQIVFAIWLLLRPTRLLLLGGVAFNVAVIAVWAISRAASGNVGPITPEPVQFVDALSSALEAVVVAGSVALLWPSLALRRVRPVAAIPVVAAIGAVVVSLSSLSLTPAFAAAADHNHSTAASGGHDHGAVATGLTGDTPCEKSGPPASEGQVLDTSGHFHRGSVAQAPLDETTRMQLEAQQEQARAVVVKYPTVADAQRAGYRESTVYVPCIGAHYTNVALAARFDPLAPSELLYDGTQPNSQIVGLSYLVFHLGGPPEGFAGLNDRWHQHTFNGGLCLGHGGLVIGSESTTAAQCTALGGTKAALQNIWMLHDWVVPGFECSWGVFAPECPELGGRMAQSAWQS